MLLLLSHSVVWLFVTPWTAACQASLSIIISWSLLKLMSTELVMPSNHLILWCPFSFCLQSFPASGSFPVSQFFTTGGPKFWRLRFNISPFNEYSGLISFRIPCNPRNSQQSSPTPQFKSINSLVLSFLYGPTLTSILDYWKNHSFN